jgi:O-antigen ligase
MQENGIEVYKGLHSRLTRLIHSQWALGVLIAVIVVASWYLWQNWGRSQLLVMGLGGIVFIGLLFTYPVIGAALAAFSMISNMTVVHPSALSAVMLLTLIILVIRKLTAGDATWTVTPFVIMGILYAVFHLCSALWAGSYRYLEWTAYLRIILVIIIFSEAIKTRRNFLVVLLAAQAATIVTGILTVQGAAEFYITGAADELAQSVGYIEQSRFYGIWPEPNMMALSQMPLIGISLVVLRTRASFWLRLISFVAVGAGMITVLLSMSRGAAVSSLLLIFAIASADRYRYRLAAGVAILAIIVISIVPMDIVGRMASLASPKTDSSINQRSQLLFGGIRMIEASFPWGVGAGNYRLYSMDYANSLPHGMIAHNTYIDVFAEAGLVGIMLFAGMLYSLYQGIRWRGRKLIPEDIASNMNVGLGAALLALTLGMAFSSASAYAVYWFYFTLISLVPILYRTRSISFDTNNARLD